MNIAILSSICMNVDFCLSIPCLGEDLALFPVEF